MFKLHGAGLRVCGEIAQGLWGEDVEISCGVGLGLESHWPGQRPWAVAHLASCLRPNLASAHLVTKNI